VVDEPSKSSLMCSVKNVDDFDDEFCDDDDDDRDTTRPLRLPPLFAAKRGAPLVVVVVVAGREFKRKEAMMCARVCREQQGKEHYCEEMSPLERKLSHLNLNFSHKP
jgi:hypothetical protein